MNSEPLSLILKELKMKVFFQFLLPLLLLMPFQLIAQDPLPQSREATLIESTSPTEVMVKAAGIGKHDPKGLFSRPDPEVMNRRAETDATKSAFYFLLYNADPPILQTEEEKQRFVSFQTEFFTKEQMKQFIAWSSPRLQSRIKLNDTTVKIEKTYKINKEALVRSLADRGIITRTADLAEQVGMPFIMVLPQSEGAGSPLERLSDEQYRKGADVIESYLTSRKYDVVVPEQTQALQSMQQTASFMAGDNTDYAYQLAMSIGSDIYITYTVSLERRRVGSTRVSKATVGVRAYETTTARLLAATTGYSEERPGGELPLIEEAMNSSVDQALGKITAYWKEDLQRGIQYKLIIRLSDRFSPQTAEELSWEISDLLKNITSDYKENVITAGTLDYLVWCSPESYRRSSDLYRALKESYLDGAIPGRLERNSLNRKLLLLEVRQ